MNLVDCIGVGSYMMLAEIPCPTHLCLVRDVAIECGSLGIVESTVDGCSVLGERESAPIVVTGPS